MNMYKVKYKNTDKNNRAYATDVYVSCVFFKDNGSSLHIAIS